MQLEGYSVERMPPQSPVIHLLTIKQTPGIAYSVLPYLYNDLFKSVE